MFVVYCHLEGSLLREYDKVELLSLVEREFWLLAFLLAPSPVQEGIADRYAVGKSNVEVEVDVSALLLGFQIDGKTSCSWIWGPADVDHAAREQPPWDVLPLDRSGLLTVGGRYAGLRRRGESGRTRWVSAGLRREAGRSRWVSAGLLRLPETRLRLLLAIGWLLLAVTRWAVSRGPDLWHSSIKRHVEDLSSAANDHVVDSILRDPMTKISEILSVVSNLQFVWERGDRALEVCVLLQREWGSCPLLGPPVALLVGIADDNVAFEEPMVSVQSQVSSKVVRSGR